MLARENPQIALAIGNEVDGYFSSNPSEFPAFVRFYRHSLARLHAALPGVPVGIVTGAPVGNPAAWIGDTLNAYSDIVLYTYYPFDNGTDFQHRPPSTFEPDIAMMRSRARALNKPLAFTEIGYASSAACNSTPAAQADFVRRFKTYFRATPRSEILFANYFLMTDWSSGTLQHLYELRLCFAGFHRLSRLARNARYARRAEAGVGGVEERALTRLMSRLSRGLSDLAAPSDRTAACRRR